jgi:hypothetical protein
MMGCSMPRGMNDKCEWPAEQPFAIDLPDGAHQRHLTADIKAVEELAIRFTDAQGKLSPLAGQRLRDCEAKLFGAIAANHGLTLAQVGEVRKRLDDWRFDPLVQFPLAAVYIAAMAAIARRIRRRFARDEWIPALAATLATSLALGVSILIVGHLWHGLVEMIRVGNTHMSYRALRLGWGRYSHHVFAVVVLMFWCVVLASYGVSARSGKTPRPSHFYQ